jgi:hypothetical protein
MTFLKPALPADAIIVWALAPRPTLLIGTTLRNTTFAASALSSSAIATAPQTSPTATTHAAPSTSLGIRHLTGLSPNGTAL